MKSCTTFLYNKNDSDEKIRESFRKKTGYYPEFIHPYGGGKEAGPVYGVPDLFPGDTVIIGTDWHDEDD